MSEVKEDEVRDLMDLGEFRDDEPFEWNPVEETETSEGTKTEETQVETKTEKQTQTETSDWFSELNKSFGTNYSSVDELKSVLGEYGSLKEKVSKIDDFDTLSSRLEKVEKERNLLIEKYRELKDPQSFFADDVEFKRNQLIKSNPSINGEVARRALTMDLGTANPLDIIALSMQLTHSKLSGGEVGAKEAFLLSKGIDVQFRRLLNYNNGVRKELKLSMASGDARFSFGYNGKLLFIYSWLVGDYDYMKFNDLQVNRKLINSGITLGYRFPEKPGKARKSQEKPGKALKSLIS